MLPNETLTILICTYNRANFLRRTLTYLQNISYKHTVIKIFDNCSTDNTKEIVQIFQTSNKHIHYFRNTSNIGPNANYKKAFQSVKTKYFTFVADDDFIFHDIYELNIEKLRSNPSLGGWGCHTIHANFSNHRIIRSNKYFYKKEGVYDRFKLLKNLSKGGHPEFQGFIFNKNILDKFNITISEDVHLLDIKLFVELFSKAEIGMSKKVGSIMYAHPLSASSGIKDLKKFNSSFIEILETIKNLDIDYTNKKEYISNFKKHFFCILVSKKTLSGLTEETSTYLLKSLNENFGINKATLKILLNHIVLTFYCLIVAFMIRPLSTIEQIIYKLKFIKLSIDNEPEQSYL